MKYVRVGADGKFLYVWECSSHAPSKVHSFSWTDIDKASAMTTREWEIIKYKDKSPTFVVQLECKVNRKVILL